MAEGSNSCVPYDALVPAATWSGGSVPQQVSKRHDDRRGRRASGGPVAESAVAPPGPIPNPVVTRRSAGEYLDRKVLGGEAAAGPPGASRPR